MTQITRTKQSRFDGKGFIPPNKPIILKNPYNWKLLPFTFCGSAGELVNWRTREKKAAKRLKKTGSPFPCPENFYPLELLNIGR